MWLLKLLIFHNILSNEAKSLSYQAKKINESLHIGVNFPLLDKFTPLINFS